MSTETETETENMLDDNEYPNVHVDRSTRAEFGLVVGVVSMDKFKQKKKGDKAISRLLKEAKQIKW